MRRIAEREIRYAESDGALYSAAYQRGDASDAHDHSGA